MLDIIVQQLDTCCSPSLSLLVWGGGGGGGISLHSQYLYTGRQCYVHTMDDLHIQCGHKILVRQKFPSCAKILCNVTQYPGADTGFVKGGGGGGGGGGATITVHRGAFYSPSIFIYQEGLSWNLRALHYKFQMYEDCRSRGRHVLLSCSKFAHERNTYIHRRHTTLWSLSQAVQFQATYGIVS